jgi:hypothetical protein
VCKSGSPFYETQRILLNFFWYGHVTFGGKVVWLRHLKQRYLNLSQHRLETSQYQGQVNAMPFASVGGDRLSGPPGATGDCGRLKGDRLHLVT